MPSLSLFALILVVLLSAGALVFSMYLRKKKQTAAAATDGRNKILVFEVTEDPEQIKAVVDMSIEGRPTFKIRLNNRGRSFSATPLKRDDDSMLIDILFPYEGNELIPDSRFLNVEFIIKQIAHVPYTFTSLYIGQETFNDYPALRITLPKSIVRDQKRNFHRIEPSVKEPVYVKFKIDGNEISEKVANISGGGLAFFTNYSNTILWNKREIDKVVITLPDPVTVDKMTIVYNTNHAQYPVLIGGKPYYYYAGAVFEKIDPRIREQIIHYIIERERDELKRINRLA